MPQGDIQRSKTDNCHDIKFAAQGQLAVISAANVKGKTNWPSNAYRFQSRPRSKRHMYHLRAIWDNAQMLSPQCDTLVALFHDGTLLAGAVTNDRLLTRPEDQLSI